MIWITLLILAIISIPFMIISRMMFRQLQLENQIRLATVRNSENDNSTAVKTFLELLDSAEKNLVIFDDGNIFEDSIYMNMHVLNRIDEKLKSSKKFKITCLFNFKEQTDFEKKFSASCYAEKVEIKYPLKGLERPDDEKEKHYKIVDDGKLVHISEHSKSDENRTCSLYNFKKVKNGYLEDIVTIRFEEILNYTWQRFGHTYGKSRSMNIFDANSSMQKAEIAA